MGLLTKLKNAVGSNEQTYHYQCLECARSFELPHADMSKVSCPDCSSQRVRSVTATEA